MKSNGFEFLRDSEGKGFLGCMAAIVLLAAMIFAGFKLGPIYYANYEFEDDLKQMTSNVGATYTSNEDIITQVLNLAGKNHINLKRKDASKNIRIERYAGQLHITVLYSEPVDFLFMQKKINFEIKLSSFTAG